METHIGNTVIEHCLWTKRFSVDKAYGHNETEAQINDSYEVELNSTVHEVLNAYAKPKGLGVWANLHLNGGKISGIPEEMNEVITTGKFFPAAETEGKYFGFWSEKAGSKEVYDPEKSLATDLYPAWDVYALKFDFENRTYTLKGYDEGEEIVYPEDPVKEGYIFVEWCTIDKTVCSPTNMSNKNMVLHPQWEVIALSSSSSSSAFSHPKSKTGLIVGLSVGIPVFIVVVVAIIVGVILFRKKKNEPQAMTDKPLLAADP